MTDRREFLGLKVRPEDHPTDAPTPQQAHVQGVV
jgi:hypothetical protein